MKLIQKQSTAQGTTLKLNSVGMYLVRRPIKKRTLNPHEQKKQAEEQSAKLNLDCIRRVKIDKNDKKD